MPQVAVYVTGDLSDSDKLALGTRISASLTNSGRFGSLERTGSFQAEVAKAQAKQGRVPLSSSQISALGKQFGAQSVCIVNVAPTAEEFQVSGRIVDVDSAKVSFTGNAYSPLSNTADHVRVSDELVENMLSGRITPPRAYSKRRYSKEELERLAAKRQEQERLAAERREQERLEAERLEQERLEAERQEQERLEAEQREQERLEAERLEQEQLAAMRREEERLEAERRREQERLERERLEAQRREQERLEAERLAKRNRLKLKVGADVSFNKDHLDVGVTCVLPINKNVQIAPQVNYRIGEYHYDYYGQDVGGSFSGVSAPLLVQFSTDYRRKIALFAEGGVRFDWLKDSYDFTVFNSSLVVGGGVAFWRYVHLDIVQLSVGTEYMSIATGLRVVF